MNWKDPADAYSVEPRMSSDAVVQGTPVWKRKVLSPSRETTAPSEVQPTQSTVYTVIDSSKTLPDARAIHLNLAGSQLYPT